MCDYETGRYNRAEWKEVLEWVLQYQMADKPRVVVLPQGYNQDPQRSVKHTLLEDNYSWEG